MKRVKRIQEMSASERKRHSLMVRSAKSTLLQSIIFGAVALLVGLGLHSYTTINRFISEASSISRSAAGTLERYADVGSLKDAVMGAYYSQNEDERNQVWTDAYRARFEQYTRREDYAQINAVLGDFADSFDLNAIYIADLDVQNNAMVYLLDWGNNGDALRPGPRRRRVVQAVDVGDDDGARVVIADGHHGEG